MSLSHIAALGLGTPQFSRGKTCCTTEAAGKIVAASAAAKPNRNGLARKWNGSAWVNAPVFAYQQVPITRERSFYANGSLSTPTFFPCNNPNNTLAFNLNGGIFKRYGNPSEAQLVTPWVSVSSGITMTTDTPFGICRLGRTIVARTNTISVALSTDDGDTWTTPATSSTLRCARILDGVMYIGISGGGGSYSLVEGGSLVLLNAAITFMNIAKLEGSSRIYFIEGSPGGAPTLSYTDDNFSSSTSIATGATLDTQELVIGAADKIIWALDASNGGTNYKFFNGTTNTHITGKTGMHVIGWSRQTGFIAYGVTASGTILQQSDDGQNWTNLNYRLDGLPLPAVTTSTFGRAMTTRSGLLIGIYKNNTRHPSILHLTGKTLADVKELFADCNVTDATHAQYWMMCDEYGDYFTINRTSAWSTAPLGALYAMNKQQWQHRPLQTCIQASPLIDNLTKSL